jgi:hypothetical protein
VQALASLANISKLIYNPYKILDHKRGSEQWAKKRKKKKHQQRVSWCKEHCNAVCMAERHSEIAHAV